MPDIILKVSVLADGRLLLDGNPVTLAELSAALEATPPTGAAVWYYRENSEDQGHPIARDVMKLIADRRLPIRLSTKPDFSDTVAPATQVAQAFAAIRERAAQRQLVIVRPDGRPLVMPALDRASAPAAAVAAVERMLPSSVTRNVAAISDTSWTMADNPKLQQAGQAIPFFGLLMGFAAIGHAVWIFDTASIVALVAGCSQADLAIIDSARLQAFPAGWQAQVAAVMRSPQIVVHDRATNQLRKP